MLSTSDLQQHTWLIHQNYRLHVNYYTEITCNYLSVPVENVKDIKIDVNMRAKRENKITANQGCT